MKWSNEKYPETIFILKVMRMEEKKFMFESKIIFAAFRKLYCLNWQLKRFNT